MSDKANPWSGAIKKIEPDRIAWDEAKSESRNGKGDGPRNCYSQQFRNQFDSINWAKEENED